METSSLMRHFQTTVAQLTQGWHPNSIIRWLFFLIPLLYFFIVAYSVLKRIERLRIREWVSTQASTANLHMLSLLFALSVIGIGLYAVILDAWSTKEWVLWTSALIFGALTILAYSTHDSCGVNVGLVIASLLGLACLFFNQWLFAQTFDMNQNIWKHIVRNLQGFNTALVLFAQLTMISRVLVYVFSWSQLNQAKFYWIVGVLATIGLTILNVLAYGPFWDVIGFIIGSIICLTISALFQSHLQKNGPVH